MQIHPYLSIILTIHEYIHSYSNILLFIRTYTYAYINAYIQKWEREVVLSDISENNTDNISSSWSLGKREKSLKCSPRWESSFCLFRLKRVESSERRKKIVKCTSAGWEVLLEKRKRRSWGRVGGGGVGWRWVVKGLGGNRGWGFNGK